MGKTPVSFLEAAFAAEPHPVILPVFSIPLVTFGPLLIGCEHHPAWEIFTTAAGEIQKIT